MNSATTSRRETQRNLLFLSTPALWSYSPYLPIVRRQPGQGEECGVLYDCWTKARRPGYGATVFLANLFQLPPTEDEFLALPKEVFDTAQEIYDAGWRVD